MNLFELNMFKITVYHFNVKVVHSNHDITVIFYIYIFFSMHKMKYKFGTKLLDANANIYNCISHLMTALL